MIIKKSFSILDLEKEAIYLNEMAGKGLRFKRALGDAHEFEEVEPFESDYRVEYTIDPLEDPQMYTLIDAYHSSKGGYYSYLLKDGDGDFVSNEDRADVVLSQRNRVDRFTGIVLGGTFILFTYMFIDQQEPLYLLVVGAALILSIYVLIRRTRMNKIVNTTK